MCLVPWIKDANTSSMASRCSLGRGRRVIILESSYLDEAFKSNLKEKKFLLQRLWPNFPLKIIYLTVELKFDHMIDNIFKIGEILDIVIYLIYRDFFHLPELHNTEHCGIFNLNSR